jgi:hypothetical protein
MPRPTAQVKPHVDAFGPDLAVEFLLAFGGAPLAVPANPKGRSRLEALVGPDRVRALAGQSHLLQSRVPIAKRRLAACLAWQGHWVSEIARRLRVSDSSVRKWLNEGRPA